MQFFCIPSLYYSFLFLRGETGDFCEHGSNYDYRLGVRRTECSLSIGEVPLSNENAIAMIYFVLNDLCGPTGKGFDAGLKFGSLPLYFDGFVTLTRTWTTKER